MLQLLLAAAAAGLAAATSPPRRSPGWVRGELGPGQLAFARAYGDHMVLAAAPAKASVWGYGTPGTTVRVSAAAEGSGTVAEAEAAVGADGTWKVYLPPVAATAAAHTVTATASGSGQSQRLADVLFGAVGVCGGQSNMEYTTSGFPAYPGAQDNVTNATKEIAAAAGFPL